MGFSKDLVTPTTRAYELKDDRSTATLRLSAPAQSNPTVVQIVPALPPTVDGVGDFAFSLASEMKRAFSVSSAFVVRKPDLGGLGALTISEQNKTTLALALKDTLPAFSGTVILHYVGYGYDPFGSPDWLVPAIREIRGRGHRVLTIFHELYASGWPWQRAFWNSAAQRRIFKALVKGSDICITSNPVYLRKVQEVTSLAVASMLPIPSNMGELETASLLRDRSRRMVIAGQKPMKQRSLSGRENRLLEACSALQLKDIVEVGEPCQSSAKINQAAVQRGFRYECTGWLPPNEVSKILGDSYCGITAYDPCVWQKSGIIASYHAHGVLTLLLPDRPDCETLIRQHIGISLDDLLRTPRPGNYTLENLARSGFESYKQSQSMSRYASQFVSIAQLHDTHPEQPLESGK